MGPDRKMDSVKQISESAEALGRMKDLGLSRRQRAWKEVCLFVQSQKEHWCAIGAWIRDNRGLAFTQFTNRVAVFVVAGVVVELLWGSGLRFVLLTMLYWSVFTLVALIITGLLNYPLWKQIKMMEAGAGVIADMMKSISQIFQERDAYQRMTLEERYAFNITRGRERAAYQLEHKLVWKDASGRLIVDHHNVGVITGLRELTAEEKEEFLNEHGRQFAEETAAMEKLLSDRSTRSLDARK